MSSVAVAHPDADGLVGGVTIWPSDVLPGAKCLLCEGQAISRETYSLLFSRLGTKHGSGDGPHSHTTDGARTTGGSDAVAGAGRSFIGATIGTPSLSITAGATASAGGGDDNWPPYTIVRYIIKVA